MGRPCEAVHAAPDPAACRLCYLYETDPRYRALWGGNPADARPVPSGRAVRVRHCPQRQRWDWAVVRDGKTVASGSARSEPEARSDADDADPPEADIGINHGAGGLGDGLLGLLAVAAVKAENPDARVTYRVGPSALPFVRLFAGYDQLARHTGDRGGRRRLAGSDRQLNAKYQEEVRGRGRTPRWVYYCRAAGAQGPPVTPPLRDGSHVRALGRDFADFVALAPFSAYPDREWPVGHWVGLERLLHGAGIPTVIVHPERTRPAPFRSVKVIGAPAERVAGILASVRGLIGLDSGLSHLAGILGTPVVALCGQTSGEAIFGAYPRVRCLYGPLPCNRCYWRAPFNAGKCRPHCPSMAGITPEQVFDAFREHVGSWTVMAETKKAHPRRVREGWFDRYAPPHLSGIDIGCQADFLNATFRRWDTIYGDGDATVMEGVPDGAFTTVYASHLLEHLDDPLTALRNWWRILRPGGHLIVCVPHRDLYEKRVALPSRWNGDHKTYWLPEWAAPEDPPHTRGLRQALAEAIPDGEIVALRILDEGYEANGDGHPGGEYSIEAVVRKPG